jgi:hypothetical protein
MAYDPARGRVVVFGGSSDSIPALGDTWEWDGTSWADVTPAAGPAPTGTPKLVYDVARARVVLFRQLSGATTDVWEWDGIAWSPAPGAATPAMNSYTAAYDAAARETVVFGWGEVADFWTFAYRSEHPDEACASGVSNDDDVLVGCADHDCDGLCDPLCTALGACGPARPRCGDSACGPIESCGSCPGDCGACAALCGDFRCDAAETEAACPGDCTPPPAP